MKEKDKKPVITVKSQYPNSLDPVLGTPLVAKCLNCGTEYGAYGNYCFGCGSNTIVKMSNTQDPIPKRYSFRRNFVRGREALLDKRPVFHRMELQKYVSSPPPTSKARP